MSIIVEQTLPYTASQLHLEDPKRWSRLFPLVRPSIKVVETPSGQAVVVDHALAKTKNPLITAIGSLGNFSSKILSESHLAAFSTEDGKRVISAEDIVKALEANDFPVKNGVLVVRASSKQDLRVNETGDMIDLAVVGELELDHVLSLLGASNTETRHVFTFTR